MPIPFKSAIDLEKNELQNARIQNITSDPGTPVAGQLYFNSTGGVLTLKFYTGSTWISLGRLDQISAPTGDVSLGSQKITNLATPSADTDAATKAYVDGLAQGLDVKGSVRVATTAAGTLATSFANGQTVDGVVLATGNRILIKNQAAPAENGIYAVNGAGAPTRATDMDVWTEVPGAFVFVEEGTTLADTGWVCSANAGGTIGSTSITFVQFSAAGIITASGGITKTGNDVALSTMVALTVKANATNATAAPTDVAAGSDHQVFRRSGTALAFGALNLAQAAAVTGALGVANGGSGQITAALARTTGFVVPTYYRANVGATTAGVIAVTHSLGTRDVQVQVVRIAAPYETIYCDCERTDTNTVTLRFGADYVVDTFRIIVVAVGV